MKVLPFVFGAAVVASPLLARAATIFDSVDINPSAFNSGSQSANISWDWVDPTANGPNGQQFTVTSPQTLTQVQLELSAALPSDGGSIVVLLLPDNGGAPPYSVAGGIATFTPGTVLATIADSSLNQNSTLFSIPTDIGLTPGNYWIGLETPATATSGPDAYGSGQWWWSQPDPSNPVTIDFNSIGGAGPFAVGGTASSVCNGGPCGDYEMILSADPIPEPATLAILGAGLAGLGYIRRRTANKA